MPFASIAITIQDDELSTAIKWSNHILHKKEWKLYAYDCNTSSPATHTWAKSEPKINIAEPA